MSTTTTPGTQIDVFTDELLTFPEAAAIIPGRPHLMTLHRWAKEGLRGTHLETVLIGGVRLTTRESLNRFFLATARPTGNGFAAKNGDAKARPRKTQQTRNRPKGIKRETITSRLSRKSTEKKRIAKS